MSWNHEKFSNETAIRLHVYRKGPPIRVGGSCRGGVGHVVVGWVMLWWGWVMLWWGGSCWGGLVMGGACRGRVRWVMQGWVGWGGSCRGGVRWVIQRQDGMGHEKY